ncbi:phage Mu protein F-like protein [Aeromonas phage 25AhydR2PP]|uniref:Phage Mu protein F-like protein n=1 Tax=Aeromonas phage 25AhydR2PP TaxID=2163976 RepID=A0A2S1PFQ4_9CAUD|nr:phage Mu protein F-like protein [Aeromonas phage 25AhydR2PP]AWH15397.1 phage Mu protein F-like protein [Aeromonas phage 25AhydR2PP]
MVPYLQTVKIALLVLLVALCGLLGAGTWHYKGKAEVASEKLQGLTREYVQLESQYTAFTEQVESADKQARETRGKRDSIKENTRAAVERVEAAQSGMVGDDVLVDSRIVDELRYAACRTQGNPSACTRGPDSPYTGTGD